MNRLRGDFERCLDVVTNPEYTKWLTPLLLTADAFLCALVIWKIPYTEIDWMAYMEQVELYLAGERDYVKIRGGTGPLVYPAAHVYIYTALYYLTEHGKSILTGQIIFAFLYLVTAVIVVRCYQLAKAPPYVFPLLVLSKRLHSIYLLRLFNDCFAVLALWITIYAYQRRKWITGSIFFSWGLGTKMSLLLSSPAIGLALYQGCLFGPDLLQLGLVHVATMSFFQVLIGIPFLINNPHSYLSKAFDFARAFQFKWTVNWRFVGEEVFSSKQFSTSLMIMHVTMLLFFISTRWLRPTRLSLLQNLLTLLHQGKGSLGTNIQRRTTPQFILTLVLTSNAIGMLFARSLHYQFYSLLSWGAPFLLWRTGLHPIIQYMLWAMQEWAWNIYPSTDTSSGVVVGVLAITVAGVWWNTRDDLNAPSRRHEKQN